MHDFICCEGIPQQALTTSDINTPIQSIHFNQSLLLINNFHINQNNIIYKCKVTNNLCDLFTSYGSILATNPLPPKENKNNNNIIINKDTDKSELVDDFELLFEVPNIINIDNCAI